MVRRNPQHIITPNQHLSELALVLALDVLDGAAELDVHVAVDADEAAGVLGLAPLEADAHVVVDEGLQHRPRVHRDELLQRVSLAVFFCRADYRVGSSDVRSWLCLLWWD